jgi:GNAT superfamily N-acetyltransferase
MRVDLSKIKKSIIYDVNSIKKIVSMSHPDVQDETGFWLYATELDKGCFERSEQTNNLYTIVYVYNRSIIGMVTFRTDYLFQKDHIHIMALQVLPEYGHNGLGAQLVQDVWRWAAQHKPEFIGIDLQTYKPSLEPFYSKLGFKKLQNKDLPYCMSKNFK